MLFQVICGLSALCAMLGCVARGDLISAVMAGLFLYLFVKLAKESV
jgi:hypothetical protein